MSGEVRGWQQMVLPGYEEGARYVLPVNELGASGGLVAHYNAGGGRPACGAPFVPRWVYSDWLCAHVLCEKCERLGETRR